MPSSSENSDAVMNHPIVLRPMRLIAFVSPMCAMPTTSVENTSGAMIILMRRRKMSVTSEMYPATVFASSGVAIVTLSIQPTMMPATIPMKIHVVSLNFMALSPPPLWRARSCRVEWLYDSPSDIRGNAARSGAPRASPPGAV
jgi:hypothetical protein